MATDLIRYDLLVQDALRGVVRNVLSEAAKNGLQGDHHFFITFRTKAPGLRLSNRMRERYPDEMTIVLQHQFWDLSVSDHAFEVGLSFNNSPERLLIPFDAVTSFVDPSVQFGLKFDVATDEKPAAEPESDKPEPAKLEATKPKATGKGALSAVEAAPKKPARLPAPDSVVPLKPHDIKPATPPVKPAQPSKPVLASVPDRPAAEAKKAADGEETKVVSIDAFRKKP